ncbi:MAG TPA: NUDIX hydrolase [Thermomicrobiales bacterium]|nr:NUDIX hydrolase [Thermomicrobiales bacterium]
MPQVIDSFDDAPEMPHEEHQSTEYPFRGKMLTVRVDKVRLPSGKEADRELVEHPGSAVIIPVTTDGRVIFVRQFRYAIGEYLLELPAGLVDEGETPEETAIRELKEEVAHVPGGIRALSTVYMSPGYTEEKTTIFLAENCMPVNAEDDPDEPIQMMYVPLTDIPRLIVAGDDRVGDAQTLLGLLWLCRLGLA